MSDFLFEIGFEEFPPSFIEPAAEFIRKSFTDAMTAERIAPLKTEISWTCSRIALRAFGFPKIQPDLREKVIGAPKKVAVSPDGSLSKAGEAFLKKYNITEYFFETQEKGDVICGWNTAPGKNSNEILLAIAEKTLSSIPFKKSMRWGAKTLLFARPIRWILFLIDDKPVQHQFHGIEFSRTSFGHRFMAQGPAEGVTVNNYEKVLEEKKVIADPAKRREMIRSSVLSIIKSRNGVEKIDEELLEQIVALTEYPHAIIGNIPQKYMELPPELITLVLKTNQRYFTVYEQGKNRLLPCFISILNNVPADDSFVAKGNEKVVAARLSDAAFYYYDDRGRDFSGLTLELKKVMFQKDLGSYFDKMSRVEKIAEMLAGKYFNQTLGGTSIDDIKKAALLLKNDLITGVVFEFPELQGTMGRYYAGYAGFSEETALAIEEHYMPRFSGDKLPQTVTGTILSLAEKFDTIAGGFMAGMKPTGTKDKFALRRNAIGLLQIAVAKNNGLNLREVFVYACDLVKAHNPKLACDIEEILDFMKQRYQTVLELDTPIVQSAVESDADIPFDVKKRAETIAQLLKEKDILDMAQLYKRSKNILKNLELGEKKVNPELLKEAPEIELFETINSTIDRVKNLKENLDIAREIIKIKPVLDRFFDKLLVMDEDRNIRENRVNLINLVVVLVKRNIGDISYLNI